MRRIAILLAILPAACAAVQQSARPGNTLEFQKRELRLDAGGVTYDLLSAMPVRSARIYDLVSRETFTRRYFVVHAEGRQYVCKTEQREGELYPRKILVETRAGFRRVLLDGEGNIVRAEAVADLGE